LASDLADLYTLQAKGAGLPAPVLDQYSAYCSQEVQWRASAQYLRDEQWWIKQFDVEVANLDLPLDQARPVQRGYASRRADLDLPADLLASLKKLAARQGSSLFSVLLSGFATTLHRLSGQDDLVIGVPAAGQLLTEMPSLVGHCVNLLPVRLKIRPELRASEQLQTIQAALLDAFERPRITFGTLLKSLQLKRDPSRLPLVNVMFNLDQAIDENKLRFQGLSANLQSLPRAFENFELFLNVTPEASGLKLECQYNTDLFDQASVHHWLRSYVQILKGFVETPEAVLSSLAVLDQTQIELIQNDPKVLNSALACDSLQSSQGSPADQGDRLRELLNRHAIAFPGDVALVAGRARLTYDELTKRVARLAHSLRLKSVGPGVLVGICLGRSADMLVAVLGVLESGAAFVPLDPSFPSARLSFMVEDAKLALVISDRATIQQLPWPQDSLAHPTILLDRDAAQLSALSSDSLPSPPPADTSADSANDSAAQPAYILYTSGSSGQPKGVVIARSALSNFLESMVERPGMNRGDRLLAVTTLSFDISLLELLLPLTVGATVVLATREQVLDGQALIELIETHEISVMQATPSGWRVLIDAGWQGAQGFKALVGGESLPRDIGEALLERCAQVWNMYGPTETTIWSTCQQLEKPLTHISIGRPIAHTPIFVLDRAGQACAIGTSGEIHIAGRGLAVGYWNRAELTAEKFVRLDTGIARGQRLYRTGDLGRWRHDGQLQHLGRIDAQVKLRGYRIELGEVESVLARQVGVADTVAMIREDEPGDARLVAYVCPEPGAQLDPEHLRLQLKGLLPDYMVPQNVVVLSSLPRLPNTKIDRQALPGPRMLDEHSVQTGTKQAMMFKPDLAKPEGELEQALSLLIGKLLGVLDVARHQDFFALGGHSLTAAQLVARVNREFKVQISLRTIFESPTVATLAKSIETQRIAQNVQADDISRREQRHLAPFSLVQERLWFLERLNPGRAHYNTPSAHRLRGPLNVSVLQRAFLQVIQRQEVLRTVVEVNGDQVMQRILDEVEINLERIEDISDAPAELREAQLYARLEALIERPFVLQTAPLFVAKLFKLAAEEHVLFFMPHHFIWDGWSFDLFYDEVSAFYLAGLDGKAAKVAELPVSYGDYCVWQKEWLKGTEFATQVDYWKQKLSSHHEIRALKTDYPRRASMSGRGSTEWIKLDRQWVGQLRALGEASGTTLFTVLLSAFSVLLVSLGASFRQSIGIPVKGRSRPETENLMGYFTNLLPLMIEMDTNQRFDVLLEQVKRELLGAYAAPDVPIEHLLSSMTGAASGRPLYLALFSFQDARQRPVDWGNLQHERLEVAQKGATEDFGLWLVESDAGLVGGLTYNTDLYRRESAKRLHEKFFTILGSIAKDSQAQISSLLPSVVSSELGLENVNLSKDTQQGAAEPPALALSAGASPRTALADGLSSDAERTLASQWQSLLKIKEIGRQDNFFDLGGNSLLAMNAVALAERHFGSKVDARRYVFESLAQLAKAYEESQVGTAVGKVGLLSRIFGGRRGA
jgi:amino acid adenylation domain-containing protein